jgi:acid phosphatase class B
MTKQELNRDIKRLAKNYKEHNSLDTSNWTDDDWNRHYANEKEIKKEFKRLYYADDSFVSISKDNVLRLIRINVALRVVALHLFGINIELKN